VFEEAFSCRLQFFAYSVKVVGLHPSSSSGIPSKASEHGLATVKQAADIWKKLRDSKNIDVLDRLEMG